MKKVIIVGASSGIGKALVYEYAKHGHIIGIASRNVEKLNQIKESLDNNIYVKQLDLREPEEAMEKIQELIREMDGCDIFIESSGVGPLNPYLKWKNSKWTIDVNVTGFVAMAKVAFTYFRKKRKGHFVGISSTAALRGTGVSPDYHASKAFISSYMYSLRHQAFRFGVPVYITDVQPGFVDTPILKGIDNLFWVASPEKVAKQIYKAVKKKRKHVYVTKRWRLIAWVLKYCPDFIYYRF